MKKLNLTLAIIGFILSILSMYILPILMNDLYSGIVGFVGLAMIMLSLYLMNKEKR
ncbi:hypothetical protein AXY_07500 [Amphibacillus xylanus NBRC 15112]|uniref:Uncharacterized protein n=1 Tax=Amphibacillus xylanus (strain ATCC 51415 / DSM 6626 / JCM 7361 / LMG 17667 / NBRC 15112 / Ep01) TaxID=698758 RepID=K0J182_AMPXN|nr:hypothetical protein AXY_07500 [Amphibacillus xylanus NBRC 15112]